MARILVVEDYPDNLALMTYLLTAAGHDVRGAGTGRQTLEAAHDDPPDIVVLDIQLPDMDGYQVLTELRADPRTAHVPVVAVTAYAMVGDRDDALAAGFDGYLPKPITPRTFAQTVESHLRAPTRASESGEA
jgi:two-component system, cell cycle response regulator DivK